MKVKTMGWALFLLTVCALWVPGCASAGLAGGAYAGQASSDDEPITSGQVFLTVYGMSCPLCANNVDKTLLDVPGVTDVAVDMGTGIAMVTLDGQTPVTRRQLATAVDRSGFSLQRIEVP